MTHCAVAHHAADVDALRERVDGREVFAVRLPVPGEPFEDGVGGDVLDGLHELREPTLLTLAHRGERDAAVAEHDRRDTVPARGGRVGIPRNLRVEVSVHVDESRRDVRTACVDLGAALLGHGTDARDPVAVDRDVGRDGRGTAAVDDGSGPDHEIVHGRRIRGEVPRR